MKIKRLIIKNKKLGVLNVDKIDFVENKVFCTRIYDYVDEENYKTSRHLFSIEEVDFIIKS